MKLTRRAESRTGVGAAAASRAGRCSGTPVANSAERNTGHSALLLSPSPRRCAAVQPRLPDLLRGRPRLEDGPLDRRLSWRHRGNHIVVIICEEVYRWHVDAEAAAGGDEALAVTPALLPATPAVAGSRPGEPPPDLPGLPPGSASAVGLATPGRYTAPPRPAGSYRQRRRGATRGAQSGRWFEERRDPNGRV